MSGMNQATHDYIVFKLGQALQCCYWRSATHQCAKNYKNFEMANGIVHGVQKTFGDTWEGNTGCEHGYA